MSIAELNQLDGGDDFKRDRWGRPLIVPAAGGKPKPYTRSSGAAKTIEDTFNLELWARRNVAFGLAHDPSLVARIVALGGTPHEWTMDQKKQVNRVVEDAATIAQAHKAADIGTALHSIIERINRGQQAGDVGPFAADIAAYQLAIAELGYQIDPAHVECRMVCDDLEMAGTCDMIFTDPTSGDQFVADLKTGASVEYSMLGYAAQLAAYSRSDLYNPTDGSRQQLDIETGVGFIIHLPAGQGICTIYEINLDAGYQAAVLANQVRAIRKAAKQWMNPVGSWTAENPKVVNLKRRLQRILDGGHEQKVVWRWPEGVPGFKGDHRHDDHELERIDRALIAIEADIEAPFDPAPIPPTPVKPTLTVVNGGVEEGPDVSADDVAILQQQIERLDLADLEQIKEVTAAAKQAGHPISVAQHPSERRWQIAASLIKWIKFGWDDDTVTASLDRIGATAADTNAARIGQLTIDQARQWGQLAGRLTDQQILLAFGPTGAEFIEQEHQAS